MSLDGWREALAAIEHDVAAAERALAEPAGRDEDEASDDAAVAARWEPPGDLGPLPGELEPRARDLLVRLEAVSVAGRTRREALLRELGDIDRRRGAGHAYAGTPPVNGAPQPRRLLRSG